MNHLSILSVLKNLKILFISAIFLLLNSNIINAQCITNTSTESCSGGNGILTNNTNLNFGEKYWWNSGNTSVSNINFSGGTFVVCAGEVTITNANLNNGTIIVLGGTLNFINQTTLNGTFQIINNSTINFTNGLNLQGNPARIFNNDGEINVYGSTHVNNTSQIINNSNFNTVNLTLQTNSGTVALCQGASSKTNVSANFSNNTQNSILSPSGQSCVFVGGDITLNQNVCPDVDLLVCDGPNGNSNGSSSWGSATVSSSCSNCSTLLPIKLVYFNVFKSSDGTIQLVWQTQSEANHSHFVIERSTDGILWKSIGSVDGSRYSTTVKNYHFNDETPLNNISFYRLSSVDFFGEISYSEIKEISNFNRNFSLFPNPAKEQIIIISDNLELKNIQVLNTIGQNVTRNVKINHLNKQKVTIDLTELHSGFYYVKTGLKTKLFYKE